MSSVLLNVIKVQKDYVDGSYKYVRAESSFFCPLGITFSAITHTVISLLVLYPCKMFTVCETLVMYDIIWLNVTRLHVGKWWSGFDRRDGRRTWFRWLVLK